jgi:hypothetical protein
LALAAGCFINSTSPLPERGSAWSEKYYYIQRQAY